MITPYPYQQEAEDSIYRYYAEGNRGNPVVVMPTATGKSIVIALFIANVIKQWPGQRIIALTHVKELIEQNAETLNLVWPDAPFGIFSAGLKQRDTLQPIVFGGVQSVVKCVEKFGHRDLMLVDEAHLISPKDGTNYQRVITALKQINPNLKIIGFTATPYRQGLGLITDPGGIFSDICFDNSSMRGYNKLIEDGYLCMLIPKHTKTELDTENVNVQAGEFNQAQLQLAVDVDKITLAACREMIEYGSDRQSWLVFAAGIKHAEHIAKVLQTFGIDAATVHSKMKSTVADERIKAFRANQLRCVVNYGKLTTGFNHKPIDLIGMMRPTMSTALWVQMLGRGGRVSPETQKDNCLVLDFARNTLRLGPVNDPVLPRRRKKKDEPGVAPVRICDACGTYNHARATHCYVCGFEFSVMPKLTNTASQRELVRTEEIAVEVYTVKNVLYNRLQKPNSPAMIKISYCCDFNIFHEYICFEHGGYATQKAQAWWRERMVGIPPRTTDEALMYVKSLRVPKNIRVWMKKKYPEVLGYEY